ncbi:MAG: replication associated protein [Microviridae sp. ctbuH30]|nr:MAG: replication associated protein [Microviridae sp. ctbuH30]
MHEADLYNKNCFITLTYSKRYLPPGGTLVLSHFQDFMKRLRFRFGPGIRFFHCGEYGELRGRPHYHALLFNFDFPDKYEWRRTDLDFQCWRSPALEELWRFGNSEIGSVTFESAAYVARYITKKITGPMAALAYTDFDLVTGEVFGEKKPEYCTMSRRPGIGAGYYSAFSRDIFRRSGFYIRRDDKYIKCRPPKFYDGRYEIDDVADFERVKEERGELARKLNTDNSPERLEVRRKVHERRARMLKRGFEDGR